MATPPPPPPPSLYFRHHLDKLVDISFYCKLLPYTTEIEVSNQEEQPHTKGTTTVLPPPLPLESAVPAPLSDELTKSRWL
jgi:hypothetical protein